MRALICIDFINEIIAPGGKLSGKGYAAFVQAFATLDKLASVQDTFRRADDAHVIHVRLGFSPGYPEHCETSPLLGKAREFGALALNTWATEFEETIGPAGAERIITKHRVNAFYQTPLDLVLRSRGVTQIYIAGVATDLAVEAAARDGHDRDYEVYVIEDCCAAASRDDHERSLASLAKISRLVKSGDLI